MTATLTRCRPALGTYVKIALRARDDGADRETLIAHSDAAFAAIADVQRAMSAHDPDSELSRLTRTGHRAPVRVSSDLRTVLACALRLSAQTDGAFDVTIGGAMVDRGLLPDVADGDARADRRASWRDVVLEDDVVRLARPLRIDLGGIAKGYAVDRALAAVPPHVDAVVEAGGDLAMRPWRDQTIAVRVPGLIRRDRLIALPMRAAAVASSAGHWRGQPLAILCPQRRRAPRVRHGMTVFAPSCMLADALTKAAFLAPERVPWRRLEATALRVDRRGRVAVVGPADPDGAAP
ncbi:MAG: FAD:protein FMN transferase [Acidobacteriota bacterium]